MIGQWKKVRKMNESNRIRPVFPHQGSRKYLFVEVFISKDGYRLSAAFDDVQVFEQDHAH